MHGDEHTEAEALRQEIARLSAENEELRSRFRVDSPLPPEPSEAARPACVLLLPDPLDPPKEGGLGPEAIANLAHTTVRLLGDRHPDIDWSAEHDLARIPGGVTCHQLSQVVVRLMSSSEPLPMTYRVERRDDGEPRLLRCLVDGEPESDRFSAAYDRQIQVVDDLASEGQAAFDAGAQHHAGWTLKAMDLVLKRLDLGLALFQAGRPDWEERLATPRPEYDPHYAVDPDLPVGL